MVLIKIKHVRSKAWFTFNISYLIDEFKSMKSFTHFGLIRDVLHDTITAIHLSTVLLVLISSLAVNLRERGCFARSFFKSPSG